MFTALKLQLTFMKKESFMLTQVDKKLITLLKAFGLDKDTTVAISVLCRTDENRQKMIDEIIRIYDKNGTVTEQEIQMIGLRLTGTRKKAQKKTM